MSLAFIALVGGVVFLLSERNAKRYYLVPDGETLVVMRGRFLPLGEQAYVPASEQLAEAYADLSVPAFATAQRQTFEERIDLDAALVEHLLGWSKRLIAAGTPQAAAQCVSYLARAEALPSITEAQRAEIVRLEREIAFYQARAYVGDARASLEAAKERLTLAATAKGKNARRAAAFLPSVETHLSALALLLGTESPPTGTSTASKP